MKLFEFIMDYIMPVFLLFLMGLLLFMIIMGLINYNSPPEPYELYTPQECEDLKEVKSKNLPARCLKHFLPPAVVFEKEVTIK